jgi:hypothetical protein
MNTPTENIDLLDNWDAIPENVKNVLIKYNPSEMSYESCKKLTQELNEIGYTIDYYLDAIPFNLQKI